MPSRHSVRCAVRQNHGDEHNRHVDRDVLLMALGFGLVLGRRQGGGPVASWYDAAAYADLAAIADFNNNRYAITTVALASVAAATAAQLKVKQSATFAEWLAFTASS